MKKVTLTAPAGDKEKLIALVETGVDILYIGGPLLSMRAGTYNFSKEELQWAVEFCKEKGVRVQLLLNAVPHNEEIEELPEYLKFIEKIGVDSVVVSDMGVFQCVKEFTNLKISVATHSSNTNWRSVEMWAKMGAHTVILDRDLSFQGLVEIRSKVPEIKLELFIHGPILLAISGRMVLNNYLEANKIEKDSKKDGYKLIEETRPDNFMPIFEDKYGTYIYTANDLCTIEMLEKLLTLDIDSLRIEGGMKPLNEIEEIIKVYKEGMDSYNTGEYQYKESWKERLEQNKKSQFINWYIFNEEEDVRG